MNNRSHIAWPIFLSCRETIQKSVQAYHAGVFAFIVIGLMEFGAIADERKADPREWSPSATLDGSGGTCVVFSRDSRVLATAGHESARLWDARNFRPLTDLLRHGKGETSIALSGDSLTAITFGNWREQTKDGQKIHGSGARVWDVATGKQRLHFASHDTAPIIFAAISQDGSQVATCAEDNKSIQIRSTQDGKLVTSLKCAGEATFVAYRPNGKELLTLDSVTGAELWNTETGLGIPIRIGNNFPRTAVFSDDGKTLVVGGYGFFATLDAKTGELKEQQDIANAQRAIFNVSTSSDAKIVAVANSTWYGSQLWKPNVGAPLTKPILTGDELCIVSPNGEFFVCRGLDSVAGIWEVNPTPNRVKKFDFGGPLSGAFDCACFSADGAYIAVARTTRAQHGITMIYQYVKQ